MLLTEKQTLMECRSINNHGKPMKKLIKQL
jgi:hypothetical protein